MNACISRDKTDSVRNGGDVSTNSRVSETISVCNGSCLNPGVASRQRGKLVLYCYINDHGNSGLQAEAETRIMQCVELIFTPALEPRPIEGVESHDGFTFVGISTISTEEAVD